MSLSSLQVLLTKQGLILSTIKDKLEILNFLLWGYNDNIPILKDNEFFTSTAHIYYRTLIIETCTLFDENKYQANNFHLITNPKRKFHLELDQERKADLQKYLDEIKTILSDEFKELRNEEISHFTLKKGSKINFSFNHILELNYLFELGNKILALAGQSFLDKSKNMEFKIGSPNINLRSLQRLLFKVNGYDYESAWNFEKR